MIVDTKKPKVEAVAEERNPSSGLVPRVLDEALIRWFSNNKVKEMFAEEVKEAMPKGTIARTSLHKNLHRGKVNLKDKPGMSTSALEAASGGALLYASDGMVVMVGLCLVALSLAITMVF